MGYIRSGLLALGSLVLAGCGSTSALEDYKAGRPIRNFPFNAMHPSANYQNDTLNCNVYGTQAVPASIITRTSSTYQMPTYLSCTGNFCSTYGGQTLGGETRSYDSNEGLRSKVIQQCMNSKGWRRYDIDPCPKGTTLENSYDAYPNDGGSCYIPDPANDQQFYTRSLSESW
jgi:hypothetical protein